MRSYVKDNLLKDEKIIYLGHRHWAVFAWPVAWIIVTVLFLFQYGVVRDLAIFPFIITIITGIDSCIDYFMSEIGVTNMRVLVKIGFLSRRSLETGLQNIASTQVEQTLLGRMLNYGTIIINDTGSTRSPFRRIVRPFEFRRAVQQQSEIWLRARAKISSQLEEQG